MNVIDSSGWIEYFHNSPRASFYELAVLDHLSLLVPVVALYEVHKILSRSVPERLVHQCIDVMRLGRVLELTDKRAIAAAKIAQQYRLPMADAVMYSMAMEFDATFWTQDIDYQGLPNVQYLAK